MKPATDPLPTLRTGHVLRHPAPLSGAAYSTVELLPENGGVLLLDQRRLPAEEHYELVLSPAEMADAITKLKVRGAPAIGIAAAYGLVIAAAAAPADAAQFDAAMAEASALLRATRPTAINLVWALGRMAKVAAAVRTRAPTERLARLAEEARAIHREDVAACRTIGKLGAENIPDGATVLTHCNAGALATGGYGTALGVIRAAREAGKRVRVIATETRPVLQGARLTAWELAKDGFEVTVITDSMVANMMAKRAVDVVVVGADRIARSGDVANKIGTYGIACLAQMHAVPFDVAAPWSTVDLACAAGDAIPIELRPESEIVQMGPAHREVRLAPEGVHACNPAFDVTPARLIRAIYTERGVIQPVSSAALLRFDR